MTRQTATTAILNAAGITTNQQLDLVDRLLSLKDNVSGVELELSDGSFGVGVNLIRPFPDHRAFLQYLSAHCLPAGKAESNIAAGLYSFTYDPIEVVFTYEPTYKKHLANNPLEISVTKHRLRDYS
jgi:hypothetical protein